MATPKVVKSVITSDVIKITPAMAESWLNHNTHNRPLRNKVAEALAEAIKRGEWVLNGDSIRFAKDGSLLDGQHRLWAIVLSETPVESLVIKGLEPDSQESMDLGARRSLKDVLALRDEPNPQALAALINFHWRYVNGHIRNAMAKPTIPQALAHLDEYAGLQDANAKAHRVSKRISVSRAMLGTFIYVTRSLDWEQSEFFMDSFESGLNLTAKSPIYVLRHYMETQRLTVGNPGTASLTMLMALFTKAWNAYRQGMEIDKLTWRAAGTNPEAFPEMI